MFMVCNCGVRGFMLVNEINIGKAFLNFIAYLSIWPNNNGKLLMK